MSLPLPSYYQPEQARTIFLERAALIAQEAARYSQEYEILPSSSDSKRIAAFGIDCQIGFCIPEASLFVPGAVEDTQRTLAWLYRNIGKITSLIVSMDTHTIHQIFHPAWWQDSEGRPPAPFTPISSADIREGRWIAAHQKEESLSYCEKLEATGKYLLTIWPYHTLLGGISHALVPALMEAAIFHSLLRRSDTHFEIKGISPLTENYSVFSAEVEVLAGRRIATFNQALFDTLLTHDRIYLFGQAKSHCVRATLLDLRRHLEAIDASLLKKIYILEDAMSPVPPPPLDPLPPSLDFPALAEETLRDLQNAGMQIVRTSEEIDL